MGSAVALFAIVVCVVSILPSVTFAGRTIRVGVHTGEPYVAVTEAGEVEGFAIDVVESIADRQGWSLEYVPGTWEAQLRALEDGSIDLLVPVSRTTERMASMEFGRESLLSTWGQVFAARTTAAETLLDLDGFEIAVVQDDAFGRDLADLLTKFEVEHHLVPFEKVEEAFAAVASGQASAAAVERIAGGNVAHAHDLEPKPILFHPTAARFAAPVGAREVLDAIDAALLEQKADETSAYHVAFTRWLGRGGRADPTPRWVAPALFALFTALAVAAAFAVVLRVRVRAATAELRERNEALRHEAAEREAVEVQLQQAQKMEAVGQLAAGVAHDFNNLLTVIQSYAEVMPGEDLRDRTSAARAIRDAAQRASHLTRQLLAFARKQTLELKVVAINEQLDELAPLLRQGLRGDMRLTLELGSDTPDVEVDPGQLEQVLLNLVVNARDAMPSGGRVTISTGARQLTEPRGVLPVGSYAELRVRDNGSGMDVATRERAFEPFFSTKERSGGTGLGLSVAYGIVRQSGGDMTVDSVRGKGTSFRILLPAAEGVAQRVIREPTGPRSVADGRTALSVLLVEDEDTVRESLAKALRRRGMTVSVASEGEVALELLGSGDEIDLVITDVLMPGMRGTELARRIADTHPGLPVLLTSGYTGEDLLEIGPDVHFLRKPFRPSELVETIRGILDPSGDAASG